MLGTASSSRPSAAHLRLRDVLHTHASLTKYLLRRYGVTGAAAEDAAQVVAMVVARKLPEVPHGTERQFVCGVTRRVAWAARRAELRSSVSSDRDVEALLDEGPDPEHELELRRARSLVDRVLEQMPDELRAVFVLHDLDGLSMAEVASLLAIPSGTVASRLRRARLHLRAETVHLRRPPPSLSIRQGAGRPGNPPS